MSPSSEGVSMYSLLKPLLFRLEPETAHRLSLEALRLTPSFLFPKIKSKPVTFAGLTFPHRLGLAAGMDKDGEYVDAIAKLGFAFIEVGGVTPNPQPGNPRPRIFRLPQAQALINRMGFCNAGVDNLVTNLEKRRNKNSIIGVNIGKDKATPLPNALADYQYCLRKIYPQADYVTINISSPNTPDLRQLQQGEFLSMLLKGLGEEQKKLSDQYQRHVPLFVKLSPDEADDSLRQMAATICEQQMAGIIAVNTSFTREKVNGMPNANETGGLSGTPLAERGIQCLRLIKEEAGNALVLIAAGGIDSYQSAQLRLMAGADLLQLYTGLIYQGPSLIKTIVNQL